MVNKLKFDSTSKMVRFNLDSNHLKQEFRRLSSVWSGESRIRTFATIKILEKLERIEILLSRRKKKPTKYNLFVGKKLKEDLSMKEITILWAKKRLKNGD